MQGDITHNFSGILEKCLWRSLFLFLVKLQANKLHLCWKDIILKSFFKYFVSTFSNFLGVAVFWRTILNGYCQSYQKICVKEGNIFNFVFVFWGNPFCTMFYFGFLKLSIALLMLKIILNILFLFLFNFKTQIYFYISWLMTL